MQCFDEWETVLKVLKKTTDEVKAEEECESSDNGDSPEHRRRDLSQSENITPSTSLVNEEVAVTTADSAEADQDEAAADGVEEAESGGGGGGADGQKKAEQLPGLFDEDDPDSNELFGGKN